MMSSNTSEYGVPAEAAAAGYPWEVRVVLLFVLPIVILGTIVGNVLVCLAVCLVPKIRNQPYTILYVSLAVADLFVAVLVMPIALLHVWAGTWRFGRALCDVFVCADVLSCTASILNLCAISVDRYQAITYPLTYSKSRVKKLLIYIAIVWGGAIGISIIPIAIFGNEHGNDDACAVSQNVYYQVWATQMSFYLPLAVIIFVNFKILRTARIILNKEKRAQGHLPRRAGTAEVIKKPSGYDVRLCQVPDAGYTGCSGRVAVVNNNVSRRQRRPLCCWSFHVPRENKAIVTLGIIMTVFILCWLPFFILAVIRPLVAQETIPNSLSDIILWLGYFNSLLNPIIYATFNKDFRRPFREILCLRCRSLKPLLRKEQYLEQYGCSQGSGSRGVQMVPVEALLPCQSPPPAPDLNPLADLPAPTPGADIEMERLPERSPPLRLNGACGESAI